MVAFEQVVAEVEALVPKVEIVEPGLIFVPVAGAVGYYGGEGPLVERIVKEIDRITGDGYRIGLADGPFAAKHAAAGTTGDAPVHIVEDDASFLASLDISAIGREEVVATFRWLGITTLGELARLPGSAIASRFGAVGLDAHRLASGRDRSSRRQERSCARSRVSRRGWLGSMTRELVAASKVRCARRTQYSEDQ